ncbi:MAG: BadF/BadG/BcrA/BcrD ATPase family protein [Chitinophagales bacterium]
MILIADSGSTKTDWLLFDKNGETIVEVNTIGMNPFFVNTEDIFDALDESKLSKHIDNIQEVHFYGAGCSDMKKALWLANELGDFFIKAEVMIKTDIEGAVFSLAENKPCIACILGTGASFRIFDGKEIHKKYSSLAYIIGDEGSGTHIAKALLRKVFYKQLPDKLEKAFFEMYNITKDELLENVYKKSFPNRYLAQFTRFCTKNINNVIIEEIVLNSFRDFATNHLIRLDEINDYPVHFIGSIAHYFAPQLQKVAKEMNFKIGTIEQKPLGKLKEYHLK